MTYRDDRDADQARITALETELAQARDKIDELEGRRSQALVLARPGALAAGPRRDRAEAWLGAPTHLELVHVFDGALPADHFEDLIAPIRELTGDTGRTEILRASFSWFSTATTGMNAGSPAIVVSVVVKDGRTYLTVTDRLTAFAGALFGGFGGGLGGGGLTGMVFASIAVPILAPVFILGWLGGVYGTARWLYRRIARNHARKLQVLFERLVAEIATHL